MGAIDAVLWDFGGVILSSPFEAFAAFERERGLPEGLIRRLNSTNPDTNAWARLERSEVDLDGFVELFEAEAADAGHPLDAREVLALLAGDVRPEMVEALRRIKAAGLRQAMLTNNVAPMGTERVHERTTGTDGAAPARPDVAEAVALFDVVLESSRAGVRKPDPRFYDLALELVGVEPARAVFLDDLGVNLKPARALGIHTIKVEDPAQALEDLEQVLEFPLR